MRQETLFSVFDDCERIRARSSDPHTSHEAAQEMLASGKLNAQCQEVLLALRDRDGSTSAEIGQQLSQSHGRYVAGRRLPDLERKGLVRRGDARRCRATGRQAITWWVTD